MVEPRAGAHDAATARLALAPDARARALAALREALAADPRLAPLAELTLDRQDLLGEGGMGQVWRVQDRRLGRVAALKLMHEALVTDPDAVRRFAREAEVTARLDPPSIPAIYEGGTDGRGRPFLLLRLIDGEPLSKRLAARHRDGARRALDAGVALLPRDPRGHAYQGMLLAIAGDNPGAIPELTAGAALPTLRGQCLAFRSMARAYTGETEAGLADLDAAVKDQPGFAIAYKFRGAVRQGLGDLEGALADWRRYLDLSGPDDADRDQVRGWIDELKKPQQEPAHLPGGRDRICCPTRFTPLPDRLMVGLETLDLPV